MTFYELLKKLELACESAYLCELNFYRIVI